MNKLLNSSILSSIVLGRRVIITIATTTKTYTRLPSSHRTFFSSSTPEIIEVASSIPSIEPTLLPLLIAVLLASTDEDEEVEFNTPPWRVEDFKDRGVGAVAVRHIARGELLIAERPICIWPQGLTKLTAQVLFDKMSPLSQTVYMSLAKNDIPNLDDIRAIRATNGFAIQLPSTEGAGGIAAMIFPKISRLNHSCCPTASQAMNFQSLRMEVYSICDIPSNSEILIEYIPNLITQTRSERHASLKASFGFPACLCSTCSRSIEEVAKSDERRIEIKSLASGLSSGRKDRTRTLARLERIRLLLKEEGYNGLPEFDDPSISNAYAVYLNLHSRNEFNAN